MKFLGYVIANDREEYLHAFEDTSAHTLKVWAVLPDFALIFGTVIEARKVLGRLRKHPGRGGFCYVLELYDAGSRWVVKTSKAIKPKWLTNHE